MGCCSSKPEGGGNAGSSGVSHPEYKPTPMGGGGHTVKPSAAPPSHMGNPSGPGSAG